MDNLQRAVVSLAVSEDDLIPSEITAMLGGEPSLSVRKGELFLASHGKQIEAKTGMWRFGGEWENPADIDRQVCALLEKLTKRLNVWKEITTRFHCYVSVGGYFHDWTGGFTLEPGTLMLLAERGLAIDFDLYASAASN